MADHRRYEELAVGHVLGGLPHDDAAEFRGHLVDCRDCRRRVAELRDIAANLADAEREERQRARTKTEVVRRAEPQPDESREASSVGWRTPRPRTFAWWTIGLLVVALALGLWTFHLRTVNAELLAAVDRQELVMEVMASGTTVTTVLEGPVQGRVATTDELVALTLVDVPQPAPDRRLVIWLVTGEDTEPVFVGRRAGSDGRVAWVGERRGADRLLVTIEVWPATTDDIGPTGTVVAEADLTAPTVARPAAEERSDPSSA